MQTKLIDGTAPRANDQEILAAIESEADPEGGGNVMVVGIRNEAGVLYRLVQTRGLSEFMGVVGILGDFDLTDELENETGMREGCDAIFSG